MSTSPVSGKGGDPVAFALGWPFGRASNPRGDPGYILVLDLPPDALAGVRALVPNGELDAYIELCSLRSYLSDGSRFGAVLGMARSIIARWVSLDSASIGRELELRLKRADPELGVEGELTAARWVGFFVEYARLVDVRAGDFGSPSELDRERRKLLRRAGLRFPEHIEEDSHSRLCSLCVGGLVGLAMGLATPHGDPLELPIALGSPVGRMLALEGGLADLLRVIGKRFEPRSPEAVDGYIRERGGRISLDAFFQSIAEEDWGRLPPIWRPGYGRTFSPKDFLLPDHQVMAEAVDARHVLGAIALSSGGRLLDRFERGRGRSGPLASQLWALAHELRDARSAQGSPRAPRIV
jgi:hypothetical protein